MGKIGFTFDVKLCYLSLFIAVMLALLLPAHALAQDFKDSLTIRYVTGRYNSELVPGESETVFMEIANTSDDPTSNILFTSDAPEDWAIEFNPQEIEVLSAGSYQTVEISITAPQNVEKGDYSVIVIADSDVGRRVMSIFFRVEKGTSIWVWVGSALGALVIAIFVVIFKRFGRD
jgi:uncharacterized membrane protein